MNIESSLKISPHVWKSELILAGYSNSYYDTDEQLRYNQHIQMMLQSTLISESALKI